MPNIAYIRPEYSDLLPRWTLLRDVIAGSEQVKKRGDVYLPRPNPGDTSPENEARYEAYKKRAVFYNATGRTLAGLTGQVMSQDPDVDLPPELEFVLEDVDGAGLTLKQQAHRALNYVTAHGRMGMWTDYPTVEGGIKVKQLQANEVRPTIALIDPWDIINWRTIQVGGKTKLALVVMSEQYVDDDDGFEEEYEPCWKVLRLGASDGPAEDVGLYVVEEWVKSGEGDDGFQIRKKDDQEVRYRPTDSAGRRFSFIPFTFVGAVNNDPEPDLPPLYDLAELNIAHYRNSADYEEAAYICGQPTPVLTGLTDQWIKEVLKDSVQLGSRAAVMLPEGGSAMLLQATPNTMPFEAMEHKEAQMKALGAKLVEAKQVQRTATESALDGQAETSVLGQIANNVSAAYVKQLGYALDFINVSIDKTKVVFSLNTDFRSNSMDASERAQLAAEWQSGAILDSEMRAALRRNGIATVTDEEWQDKRETEVLNRPITPPAVDPNKQDKNTPPV